MMEQVKGAVIEDAGYANPCELLTYRLGINMGKQLGTSPDQHVDLNPFAHGIAEHCSNGELVCTPEINLGLPKSFSPQLGQECLLFGAAIWPRTMVCSTRQSQLRGHPPTCKVDVLSCNEKATAHREQGGACIDAVRHLGIGSDRCISLRPPVIHLCLYLSVDYCYRYFGLLDLTAISQFSLMHK
jgi:hypothetical protein